MTITPVLHKHAMYFGGHCFELSAPADEFEAAVAKYLRDYAPEAYATKFVEWPPRTVDGVTSVVFHRFGSAD